jgi:hypothetical protein
LYWQNRGWGKPAETVQMVVRYLLIPRNTADKKGKLYAQGLYMKAPPIPGAKESLLKLKEMGYE